ncbi:hypothetical protein N0V83_003221 [Neocucurbitaria cava]|uniref:RING-type domain-containing protein n=1 Tax=Neocucurbitaria cava TaxID=798079 RepID=A0A9W9CP29_9PLEO|nr:hypothetical protein N0V83_003221 [Neocucurbitaria cava]
MTPSSKVSSSQHPQPPDSAVQAHLTTPIQLFALNTMSEPTLPFPQTGDAAVDFINNHTVVDNDVPLLNECPICLDNFTSEPCLRITEIEGCNHQIGLTCLREILRSHPGEEKRCPLCRTVWISATAAPTRTVPRSEESQRNFASLFEDLDGIGENIANRMATGMNRQIADATTSRNVPRRNMHGYGSLYARDQRNTSMQNPILLDSDSETEDYETRLKNYESLSRDIETIRARARNTQLSRSQRH